MLDKSRAIDSQKLAITVVKEIPTWTQISCSSYSILRTLRVLKKLDIRQRIKDLRKKIVEVITLVPQDIKGLPQQLGQTPLSFY